MQLRKRRSPVAIGAETLPPPSPLSRVTQLLYLLVLLGAIGYIAYLGWHFFTRLEVRGVVLVDTVRVAASREGRIDPRVAAGDAVEAGDLLATIDPQLGCAPSLAEDSRLEQVRHQLRVAEEQEKLTALELKQLQTLAPGSTVRRALELDSSRGNALIDWELRVQRVESDLVLARAMRESLEQRQVEILAQAALGNTLAPECRTQSLRAPFDGRIEAVFPGAGEFVDRGQTVLLLRTEEAEVFIEIYPDSKELAALDVGENVRVKLPDGQLSQGSVVGVGAASVQSPTLETHAYVPLQNALRARIAAADRETAALWEHYLRMDVEVLVQR